MSWSPSYTNMNPSDYSSPYYMGNSCPLSYRRSSTSSSQIPPASPPDLYYEYGLETPPSVETPIFPLTWDFTEPDHAHAMTCHPNTSIGAEMTCYECRAMSKGSGAWMVQLGCAKGQETLPHPMPHPHDILDSPFTPNFVSPVDTLLGPWVLPSHTALPTPPLQSSPKLHQPRPSRMISIVNLDELASACPRSDRIGSEGYAPYQWPKQSTRPYYY